MWRMVCAAILAGIMEAMGRFVVVISVVALSLAGCAESGSALARAESTGVLNVGVVEDPPRAVAEEGGDVSGSSADMISAYAQSINANPTWRVGSLEALAEASDRGEVDVIIGASGTPDGMVATDSGEGGAALIDTDERPLLDSINAWVADQ